MGKGPKETPWRNLSRRLGIDDRIDRLGWLPLEEEENQYLMTDVFVFTSMRETSPTVVLESLAAGTPVIGLDHQGMADMVTEKCGILVPVESPQQVITGLADAIQSLSRNIALREKLSRGAAEQALSYLWSRLGERMAQLYYQSIHDS